MVTGSTTLRKNVLKQQKLMHHSPNPKGVELFPIPSSFGGPLSSMLLSALCSTVGRKIANTNNSGMSMTMGVRIRQNVGRRFGSDSEDISRGDVPEVERRGRV